MTSRSDRDIKTSQHTLHTMWELMGQDYDPNIRVGALTTYVGELAKLSQDGLIREQDRGLIYGLHALLIGIEHQVALARDLASTFKPLHRGTP